eukprot:gene22906-27691_t
MCNEKTQHPIGLLMELRFKLHERDLVNRGMLQEWGSPAPDTLEVAAALTTPAFCSNFPKNVRDAQRSPLLLLDGF